MNRTDVINMVAEMIGAETYLEVGLGSRANYHAVKIANKEGCDIKGDATYKMRSDKMWKEVKRDKRKYDIVFVDGSHDEETALLDMTQALKVAKVVICHDVWPDTPRHALPEKPSPGAAWCGTVYRAFARITRRKGVSGVAITDDHGVGILWRDNSPTTRFYKPPGYDELKAGGHIELVNAADLATDLKAALL